MCGDRFRGGVVIHTTLVVVVVPVYVVVMKSNARPEGDDSGVVRTKKPVMLW